MDAEARTYRQLADEAEQALTRQQQEFEQRLKALQAASAGQQQAASRVGAKTRQASAQLTLNEELTRILIPFSTGSADRLTRSREAAEQSLKQEGFAYI